MDVAVKIQGVLDRSLAGCKNQFDLTLPNDATAGDLIGRLAEQPDAPLRDAIDPGQTRFPRHIRMFSNGEMLSTLGQPLVRQDGLGVNVNIVILNPMMGG
ncbi:MAG: hypothetical protein QF570_07690 [Myxococcota bacterium]|jgi:hypothetical protein|nr:hypothetical protein [Myxococcota bacterium]